jgi:FKBP-type peptidyl-prolyl cis-trans isomerase
MSCRLILIALFVVAPLALIGGDQPNAAPTQVQGDPVTLPGGLQLWDLVVGKGAVAKSGKRVRVHYTGWLSDGKKFDSSLDSHHPYVFPLGRGEVIRGWDEGVVGMREGGKRQLRIPPDLAYGEKGSPPVIPENATLIFEIQLLDVER